MENMAPNYYYTPHESAGLFLLLSLLLFLPLIGAMLLARKGSVKRGFKLGLSAALVVVVLIAMIFTVAGNHDCVRRSYWPYHRMLDSNGTRSESPL